MKGMLAVLARELTEWRLLFLVALITGLIPLAAPWLPSPGGLDPAEVRDGTALGLALIASGVLAFLLGSSVLARDLSEGRLGFYFARPLPGAAIWAGKMLGATILTIGAGFLILLPTVLVGGNVAPAARWGGSNTAVNNLIAILMLVLGVLLLLVTSHAVSVMVRSRSPWLALDIAALALVVAALRACERALLSERAISTIQWMEIVLTGVFLVAVAAAGLVQVARGRTDLRRGHRLLSLTLWSLLGAATLGSIFYTRWVLGATPRDLVDLQNLLPAPSGSWIAVGGRVAGRSGYQPTFLLDLASGRSFNLESLVSSYEFNRFSLFSRDGSRAVWLSEPAGEGVALMTLDLRRPGAVPVRTTVSYPSVPRFLALSPDGLRVAAHWYDDRLTVDDLRTGRLLVSQSMPPDPDYGDLLHFLDRGHLWIFQSSQIEEPGQPEVWRLAIRDLDIATRRISLVRQLDIPGPPGGWRLSPDGKHALLRPHRSTEYLFVDLRTGRTLKLPVSQDPLAVTFLADGRLTFAEEDGGRILLRLLSPEGSEQLRAHLPGARILVGGQPTPGLLAVATRKLGSDERSSWTSWLLDLQTGRVRRLDSGLLPTTMGPREPGSLPSRLFYRRYGDLLLLDPATGKFRTVLPGTDSPSRSVQIFRR